MLTFKPDHARLLKIVDVELYGEEHGVLLVEEERQGLFTATARPSRAGPLAELIGGQFTGATPEEAVTRFEEAAHDLLAKVVRVQPEPAGPIDEETARERGYEIGTAADVGYSAPGHAKYVDQSTRVCWPPKRKDLWRRVL